MNNEEPQLTQIANIQIANAGHKLPEQAQVATCNIPRPLGFSHLINQWQPMGIRVTLNIPFVGNDRDYIFAIRNGPFIPDYNYVYNDAAIFKGDESGDQNLTLSSYAWNNMRNVIHAKPSWVKDADPGNDSIYITQYDSPPVLSSFATMFRKWRGTMHYRIRTVAGFTTQGYPFVSMVRNMPSAIGIYDQFKILPSIQRQDASYKEAMINSYVMGDTAMVRHFEVAVPYEYPTPYYDQFAWIGRRVRPAQYFYHSSKDDPVYKNLSPIVNEPHGDNFIVVGLRGALNTSVSAAQITFELEYRADEDFQFSDPALPTRIYSEVKSRAPNSIHGKFPVAQIPSKDYKSDGLGLPEKVPSTLEPLPAPARNARLLHSDTVFRPSQPAPSSVRQSRRPLAFEGEDEVDELINLDKLNLRKSLRT